jgi:uncharacterized membrane protein
MFPLGNGLIRLSLSGIVALAPSAIYLLLEILAIIVCVYLYWRKTRRTLGIGFALPVVPLWFAWRSLTTYFYFVTLPALALALSDEERDAVHNETARPIEGTVMIPTETSSEAISHE